MKEVKTDFFRYKIYVVLDAYCDYILGYALGSEITAALIREAYRDAMRHVRELTGGYHLWRQIVADRWGLVSRGLRAFFERQAQFTPPSAGLARSKVIERSFGTEWHAELKRYNNYAGHNITARSRANPDFIERNRANFPTAEEGPALVAQFIETMRTLPWKQSGLTRREAWTEGFRRSAAARARPVSEATYLSLFGEEHPRTCRLSSAGLRITLCGRPRRYDIPPEVYRDAVGREVRVTYDPERPGRILVGNGEVLGLKRRRREELREEALRREELLERARIDAQSFLQAGRLGKEERFAAVAALGAGCAGGVPGKGGGAVRDTVLQSAGEAFSGGFGSGACERPDRAAVPDEGDIYSIM